MAQATYTPITGAFALAQEGYRWLAEAPDSTTDAECQPAHDKINRAYRIAKTTSATSPGEIAAKLRIAMGHIDYDVDGARYVYKLSPPDATYESDDAFAIIMDVIEHLERTATDTVQSLVAEHQALEAIADGLDDEAFEANSAARFILLERMARIPARDRREFLQKAELLLNNSENMTEMPKAWSDAIVADAASVCKAVEP